MTQSFDELWQQYKKDDTRFNIDVAKRIYESCTQSRQAEIDELKTTIVKYEAGLRKNKANKHKLLAKNIELQKRIDGALNKLESKQNESWKNWKESADMMEQGASNAYEYAYWILKGNKDEN